MFYLGKSCHVYPNFCVVPWVVDMGMYGNYDISLGGFLELFCFNKDYHCPNKQVKKLLQSVYHKEIKSREEIFF